MLIIIESAAVLTKEQRDAIKADAEGQLGAGYIVLVVDGGKAVKVAPKFAGG